MYAKSNPSDARANNRRLLFRLLFPDRQLSRADLCKETGLARHCYGRDRRDDRRRPAT